jgi:hypothetical protein
MSQPQNLPSLDNLEFVPFLDEQGKINEIYQGKIGVYGIFNQDQTLQVVSYSRDIYLSLKQHLVRKPLECYWLKVKTIERPSRTILEEIKLKWIEENGQIPLGNGEDEDQWHKPIEVKPLMSDQEKEMYQKEEEKAQIKLLKKVARRIESQIQEQLEKRGVIMEFRFNPKLKEQGLLDLK